MDALGESFDDGRFADARLADQHGVVFRPAAKNLNDALDLVVASDERVEFVVGGVVRQVARKLGEVRRLFLLRGALVRAGRAGDLFAHGVQAQSAFVENLGGHRTLFAQESEQKMLGADVAVLETVALFVREGEHALGLWRKRQFDAR